MTWKDILFKMLHVKSLDELSPHVRQRIRSEVQPLLPFARPDDPAVLGKAWEIANSCLTRNWLEELETKNFRAMIWLALAEAFVVLLIVAGNCRYERALYQRQAATWSACAENLDEANRIMGEFQKKLAEKENAWVTVGAEDVMHCQGPGFSLEIKHGDPTLYCVPVPGTRWAMHGVESRRKD